MISTIYINESQEEINSLKNKYVNEFQEEINSLKNIYGNEYQDEINSLKNKYINKFQDEINSLKNNNINEFQEEINALKNKYVNEFHCEINDLKNNNVNEFQDEINELKNKYGNENDSCFFELFKKLKNRTFIYINIFQDDLKNNFGYEFQNEINSLKKKYGNEYEFCFIELFNKLKNNTFVNDEEDNFDINISQIEIPEYEIQSQVIEIFYKPEEIKRVSFNDIKTISLNLSSIKDLVNEGWKIKNNINIENKENGLTIGFLGNYLNGKTYYCNQIFNTDIELKPTETINCYLLNDKIRVLDVPGLNKPLLQNELKKENILENNIKDFIIEKFILDNCLIIIIVIDTFNLIFQKKLDKLKKELNENNISEKKSIYIIHNNFKIKNEDQYFDYIETNFPEDNYYNKNNYIYAENSNSQENKFQIFHFIPKLYNERENIKGINQLFKDIINHNPLELLNFNDMLKNTFAKIGKILFDMEKSQLKFDNDNFKIEFDEEEKKEKEKEYENLNEEEKLFNQLKNFNKLVSWNNFKITSPNYCCFIDNNNNFVVQIELVNFDENKIKINFKKLKSIYIFHIVAKKNKPAEYKKMIQDTRTNDDVDFEFKIPIDTFKLNSNKYEQTYEKGLVNFIYKSSDENENED